jgi:hypothetical protein
VTVRDVMDTGIVSLRFRRAMVGSLREQWRQLKFLVYRVILTEEQD